jgi:uncharacterized protein (TIGR03435 family)
MTRIVSMLLLVSASGLAQPRAAGAPEFEAWSVRLVASGAANLSLGAVDPSAVSPFALGLPTVKGGPGTSSPGRIRWTNVTLMYLLMRAYGIQPDQVRGPDRLTTDKYAVEAIVPSGTTAEQFRQMLQNLLLKRFRPAFQWEARDFKVYRLVVTPGGPKLRPSAVVDPEDGKDEPASQTTTIPRKAEDGNGCPILPLTRRGAEGKVGGSNCSTFVGYSISDLTAKLADYVGTETATTDLAHISPAHLIDATNLNGRYDFRFNYNPMYFFAGLAGSSLPPDRFSPSESIFKVIQTQLGLKLEPATMKLKVMLIQHIESDPGEN